MPSKEGTYASPSSKELGEGVEITLIRGKKVFIVEIELNIEKRLLSICQNTKYKVVMLRKVKTIILYNILFSFIVASIALILLF